MPGIPLANYRIRVEAENKNRPNRTRKKGIIEWRKKKQQQPNVNRHEVKQKSGEKQQQKKCSQQQTNKEKWIVQARFTCNNDLWLCQ